MSEAGPLDPPRWSVRLLRILTLTPLLRAVVATESVPPGQPRRQGCPSCAAPVGLDGGAGVLLPRGRCDRCGTRVGAPALLVELAVVLAGVGLVLAGQPILTTLAFAWWAGCAVALTFVDVAVHRLPDRLTWTATAGTWALLALAAVSEEDPARWGRALIAGTALAALFAASTLLLGRRGFGLGDAKLVLSSGAVLGWLGWGVLVGGLLLTFVASAVCALAMMAAGRVRWSGHLPFGPFIVLGTFAAIVVHGGVG
ncbi:A24 family peptidase [Polymorphospora sp. NPDC050346]|uniref:prepilin peptidase n=1 Tax=Polymorphospora sp. NPDC050346 TaxID=3155780 RepID=UPI0033DCC4C8